MAEVPADIDLVIRMLSDDNANSLVKTTRALAVIVREQQHQIEQLLAQVDFLCRRRRRNGGAP